MSNDLPRWHREDDLLRDRGIRSEVIRGQKTRDQSIIPRGDKGRPVLYNRRTRQWSHVEKVKASVAEPRSTMETSRTDPSPYSSRHFRKRFRDLLSFLSFLSFFLIGFFREIGSRRDADLFNFCALFFFFLKKVDQEEFYIFRSGICVYDLYIEIIFHVFSVYF